MKMVEITMRSAYESQPSRSIVRDRGMLRSKACLAPGSAYFHGHGFSSTPGLLSLGFIIEILINGYYVVSLVMKIIHYAAARSVPQQLFTCSLSCK